MTTASRDDDIIDKSHKGPVQVYVAPYDSNGYVFCACSSPDSIRSFRLGDVWTKLYSEGYSSGSWAVDKLIAAHGQHSIIIPDLPAGQYLFRAEIVALHEADVAYTVNPIRGAQNYMSCTQIQVTSNGTDTLSDAIALPGAYTSQTPVRPLAFFFSKTLQSDPR